MLPDRMTRRDLLKALSTADVGTGTLHLGLI